MRLLAINGSPRRDKGNTDRILSAVLLAAESAGASTQTMYLADEDPKYCVHCGHSCFSDGKCVREPGATARSERIREADALVLGAPVYCWQSNALTGALFDKFRIPNGTWLDSSEPGIPAMGVAVAGGTGTGVFPALQSIYSWFCAWRFAPLEPVPVTRYNIDRVVKDADRLADALLNRPYPTFSKKWNQMLLYDQLRYLSFGRIDEYEWLAKRMAEDMTSRSVETATLGKVKAALSRAEKANEIGDLEARAQHSLEAFELAFPACR